MKLNENKCHLLVGGYKHQSIWAKIVDARIWESNKQLLLRLLIHRTLFYIICFSKVAKLYDSNTKENPDEILH